MEWTLESVSRRSSSSRARAALSSDLTVCKLKRLLPKVDRCVSELRWQAGESDRVSGVKGGLILPKAAHGFGNGRRRSAFQGVADRSDGRVAAGGHQVPGRRFDLGEGCARGALAGGSEGIGGARNHAEIVSYGITPYLLHIILTIITVISCLRHRNNVI